MNITVNSGLTVDLTATSRLYKNKQWFVQWHPMVQDEESNWIDDPNVPNDLVACIAEGADYDTYTSKSDSDLTTAYTTFLQEYYNPI